eukprot:m.21302 g.21302  ORF g.21302 m.21302 type:complete len:103 (-) comp5337_c0_seq2:33-341(-)
MCLCSMGSWFVLKVYAFVMWKPVQDFLCFHFLILALKRGSPAIAIDGGHAIVQGCDFQDPKSQMNVASSLSKVVFANNIGVGKLNISGAGQSNVKTAANAFD